MKSFLAVAIVAAAFAALSLTMKAPYATIVARNAPDTKLETAHGKLIDFKDASAGALVFFGYTRCRDACPTTLARLARENARVLFVTIDPLRDHPATLLRYLRAWPSIEGVTGSADQIARTYAAFTGAGALPAPDDHDARVFAVDRSGEIRDALVP